MMTKRFDFKERKPRPVVDRILIALAGAPTQHKNKGRLFRNMMWRR